MIDVSKLYDDVEAFKEELNKTFGYMAQAGRVPNLPSMRAYVACEDLLKVLAAIIALKSHDKKVIDVTGIELTPGDPANCAGNGKQDPLKCCCDECDYMQLCMEKKEFWEVSKNG